MKGGGPLAVKNPALGMICWLNHYTGGHPPFRRQPTGTCTSCSAACSLLIRTSVSVLMMTAQDMFSAVRGNYPVKRGSMCVVLCGALVIWRGVGLGCWPGCTEAKSVFQSGCDIDPAHTHVDDTEKLLSSTSANSLFQSAGIGAEAQSDLYPRTGTGSLPSQLKAKTFTLRR